MFETKTVLILGAGASMPYGFPSGRTLLFDITDSLRNGIRHTRNGGDPDLAPGVYLAVKWFKFSEQKIEFFTNALSETMQPSIDAFLEMYPEYMDIGKVAIAASLIPYERQDALMHRDRSGMQWYEYFFNLIRNPSEFRKGNLSIVTFNYDRSLEYFLYYAFMNSYHMESVEAIDLMKQIPIVHIYGNLGSPKFLDNNGRDYDSYVHKTAVEKCVDGLKIISEVEESHPTFPQVYDLVSNAQQVIFLGFSFFPVNVQRLKLTPNKYKGRVFGTVYGMMDGEIMRVQKTLYMSGVATSNLSKLDTLNFLRETDYF